MKRRYYFNLLLCFFLAAIICLPLATFAQNKAVIAIIVDDIGDNWERGMSLVNIPADLTVSILPYKKYSRQLAVAANNQDKEVMLHLPMQAIDADKDMGPGGLTRDMTKEELIQTLHSSLLSLPYVSGINNHMGSLLTSQTMQMNWLMQEIKQLGNLYFVDSRTHHTSVANFVASENNLSHAKRDIFLDHIIESEIIDSQFSHLIENALSDGFALAIGHPHQQTIEVLMQRIPQLESLGVTLVRVSEYIRLQQQRENIWHASLSHSPRAAKN